MIIIFNEDQTVEVVPNFSSLKSSCEDVDVEDGVYQFYDEHGQHLIPHFITPVERSKSFLGTLIGNGDYELVLDTNDDGTAFDKAINMKTAIDPNPWFATIEDLVKRVIHNREQR